MRSVVRRRLDHHLIGLEAQMGPRPQPGWIRTIRHAIGMSTRELARRMGVSQSRVIQFEHAELNGSLRIATLEQAAAALNCRLCYVLVPREPLEVMVHRQALELASVMIAAPSYAGLTEEEQSWLAEARDEQIECLAEQYIDRRGLWTAGRVRAAHSEGPDVDDLIGL
jgi:predicted DNA-binding mobile mystery protein A